MTKLENYLAVYLSELENGEREPEDFDTADVPQKFAGIHPNLTELKERFSQPVQVLPHEEKIIPGVVVEKEREGFAIPFTAAVLRIRGELADVAVMSYAYELATEYDLIVPFRHPLRDTWILEGDMVYSVPVESLQEFDIVGKVQDEDCELLLNFIDGKLDALPSNRKGAGSFLDVKRRFKDVELQRSAFLASAVFWAAETAERGNEEDFVERIQLPLGLREYLNARAAEVPAAGLGKNSFMNDYVSGIFDEMMQSLTLTVYDEFHGKFGQLEFENPDGSIVIYKGIFKRRMRIVLSPVQRVALFSFENNLKIKLF